MTTLPVRLLLFFNRFFPRLRMNELLETAKRSASDYFDAEMDEGRAVLNESASELALAGKRVLDLGSGLGGKTCLYAQTGARHALGLDIRWASVRQAQEILRSLECPWCDKVSYVMGDGAAMPFEDGTADIIITVNVFEHLADPEATLGECTRILDTGGRILIRFSPWYSPWGPHLNRWINLPWPHLLFSDAVLIAAACQIETQRHLSEGLIKTAQIELQGLKRLPDLNRLTIAQFERLVRKMPLRIVRFKLLPFGYDFLGSRGWWGAGLLLILRAMTRIPLLREAITTKILCVLERT